MKRIYTIIVAVLITASVFAQAPEKMSYQAVIRDASDNLVTNINIGMQISILQGSASVTVVYVERHFPTTNVNGLVSIEIGDGTVVSGGFSTIDWANGPYFIKTETDLNGGANYTVTGISQLLTVPYALHSKTAETITGEITESQISDLSHTTDTDTHIDSTGIASLGFVAGEHTINTDTQLESTDITNLGFVAGGITTEVDGSITNEIQDLQLAGNILTITNNGTATNIDLSSYLDNTDTQLTDTQITALGYIKDADDDDSDITNEIQTISRTGLYYDLPVFKDVYKLCCFLNTQKIFLKEYKYILG